MWRDLVAVAVLAALFVAALLSMPGETPTERERFLRERWERCEASREIEKSGFRFDGDGDCGRCESLEDFEHAARAAVEVGR